MTDLVVDSCVVIKWLTDEPGTPAAKQLLDDCLAGSTRLLAPDLFFPEISSVLWKKVQRRLISADTARNAFLEFRQVPFAVTPSADLIDEALQIAFEHHQSPCDCLYVALSNRAACSLITTDEILVRKLSQAYPQVVLLNA